MADLQVSAEGAGPFEFSMDAKENALNEVVVVGYGTQKNSNVTG